MDTNSWTIEEIGIYQRLLLTQWVNGVLPDDEQRLARIAGCSLKKFQKWWKTISIKFIPAGTGQLVNKKMEEVRENQLKYSESRRKNVSVRYKDKPTYEPTHVEHMNFSSSSSSNKEKKYIKKRKILLPDEEWLNQTSKLECYSHLDVKDQLQKCIAFFGVKNITVSRARFLNWLNNPRYNAKPISIKQEPKGPRPKYKCAICGKLHEIGEVCNENVPKLSTL